MEAQSSRNSGKLGNALKSQIVAGKMLRGDLIPSVRELSREYELAPSTVLRALKELMQTGYLAAESRRGYRVIFQSAESAKNHLIACIVSSEVPQTSIMGARNRMLSALQKATATRGGALLVLDSHALLPDQVQDKLRQAGPVGAVLDTYELRTVECVRRAGIPAVIFDSWVPDSGLDSVMQDGQMGGLLAVRHLVAQGRKRMAWFGTMSAEAHSLDRFGGVAAGLEEAGLDVCRDLRIQIEPGRLFEQAMALLSRPDRPDGVVALWREYAEPLCRAADRLGLKIGRDLELVGWSTDEEYHSDYEETGRPAALHPFVTWSVQAMADTVCVRLAERRLHPASPALRVKIPVRLRLPEAP